MRSVYKIETEIGGVNTTYEIHFDSGRRESKCRVIPEEIREKIQFINNNNRAQV